MEEQREPMQSPDIGKLAEALALFQSEIPKIDLDAKVTVKTKAGSSYQFEYATLQNIMRKALPVLTKHGLSVSQTFDGSQLKTMLMHKSGQSINSTIPVDVSTGSMQEIGSRISYMRRYQLSPMLGIVAEADDDANIADGNTYQKQAKKQPAKAAEKPKDAKDPAKWMTAWLAEASKLRGQLGDEAYYRVLKEFDIDHANQVQIRDKAKDIFTALTVALDDKEVRDDKNTATGETPGDEGSGFPPAEG